MNSAGKLEYWVLFAASIVAALWFFTQYPSQDPKSAVEIGYSKNEIQLKAAEKFSDLGFSLNEYTITTVSFTGNSHLLDSLQHYLGRPQAIRILKDSTLQNIKPYFWEITFKKSGEEQELINLETRGPSAENTSNELQIRIDPDGKFMALINESEHLPQHPINRRALGAVFENASDSIDQEVIASWPDSILQQLLYFNLNQPAEAVSSSSDQSIEDIQARLAAGLPYQYSASDAYALADFYLAKTGWDRTRLVQDSVFMEYIQGVNAVAVRYTNAQKLLGQRLQLDVVVAPTGALLQLRADYNPTKLTPARANFLWDVFISSLVFIFVLAVLVIFFFRIRARAIDTRPALVAAVVMGLAVMIFIFLKNIGEGTVFNGSSNGTMSVLMFIQMGINGALASLGFFMLFAVGDSMTREYWPQQLWGFDYLRQGMLFNKPLGMAVLRSVALAFILSGIWTVILQLFPNLYFNVESIFIAQQAGWPPLYLLLYNDWLSFMLMTGLFLILASGVYGLTNKVWLAGGAAVLASGCITPVVSSFGSPLHIFLAGSLLGIALFFIYYRWGFLTILLSHFLFLSLLGSATGWIISNSFDSYIFMSVGWLFVVLTIGGVSAIYCGEEEQELPTYVPEYVDELAQEQHIKQELEIARQVQQSFLPTKTPQIKGLDIAAICRPAYETGGDYYDFIPLDEHRTAIAIGDVSGKGIQAAFYMTFVKGLLHSLAKETDSPAEVVKKTNQLFYENATKGTFISLIYGVIDLKARTFTFARAGHNPVLHIQKASGSIKELQPGGLGIGLTKGEKFDNKIQEIELSITSDDLFVLYTDGIVEALNGAHEFYGTSKLIPTVEEEKDQAAKNIISSVSQHVTDFIGQADQHDDMTLMAIRFTHEM